MPVRLTSVQRKYIRKRTKVVDLDPSETIGELNIIPFLDIVVNLIMFLLITTEAVLLISQIQCDLPKIAKSGGGKNADISTPLNLNVTVTEKGVLVSGSGGKLAPGCERTETGGAVTVPKKSDKYDWKALTECVAKVKKAFPGEETVTVSANPIIAYENVVAAMDAVRNKGNEELFPHVMISVGVR